MCLQLELKGCTTLPGLYGSQRKHLVQNHNDGGSAADGDYCIEILLLAMYSNWQILKYLQLRLETSKLKP